MVNDNCNRSHLSHALAGSVGFAPIPPPHDVRRGVATVGLARAGQLSRGEGFRDVENVDRGAGQVEERCARQLPYRSNASIGFVFAINGTSQWYGKFPARVAQINISDSRRQGPCKGPVRSERCFMRVIRTCIVQCHVQGTCNNSLEPFVACFFSSSRFQL